MKRIITFIKWIGMVVIILWAVFMMAAFMSGFIFGTGSNNVDLSNPTPEPTHSDSNSEWVNGFEDYYRSIEQSTTAPIPDDYEGYSNDEEDFLKEYGWWNE